MFDVVSNRRKVRVSLTSPDQVKQVLRAVDNALSLRGSMLKRSLDKTEVCVFELDTAGQQVCYAKHPKCGRNYQKPFQYLGFTFDGQRMLIRAPTLAKYHRRLRYAVRSAKRIAKKNRSAKVYRKELNRKFTHLGNRNFITAYAQNALQKMGDGAIKRQIAGNYERVTRELQKKGRRE